MRQASSAIVIGFGFGGLALAIRLQSTGIATVLVCVLPLYTGVVLALLVVMTCDGVTNHMGWEMFLRGSFGAGRETG